ncbi:MAG: response regulator transcription factor [Catonella sp.]|nr:response regulator transcription factor [Catonella sp.]MDY6357318.1 response regulator transcription factor [Catonella sp.]
MTNANILVVEDDKDNREGIRQLLSSENYTVTEAGSGEEGLRLLTDETELVILDIMLPGISGLQTCEKIRETSNVPVLFLTAKSQESDKLLGLMTGGDDYLTKPFSYAELLGRIKALLRRYKVYLGKGGEAEPAGEEYFTYRNLKVNLHFNEVLVDGKPVDLADVEYQMLLAMVNHPNQIYSAEMLYELIWNEPYSYTDSNTVMVHIHKIRAKVEKDPQNPEMIKTVWGKGYRFEKHL